MASSSAGQCPSSGDESDSELSSSAKRRRYNSSEGFFRPKLPHYNSLWVITVSVPNWENIYSRTWTLSEILKTEVVLAGKYPKPMPTTYRMDLHAIQFSLLQRLLQEDFEDDTGYTPASREHEIFLILSTDPPTKRILRHERDLQGAIAELMLQVKAGGFNIELRKKKHLHPDPTPSYNTSAFETMATSSRIFSAPASANTFQQSSSMPTSSPTPSTAIPSALSSSVSYGQMNPPPAPDKCDRNISGTCVGASLSSGILRSHSILPRQTHVSDMSSETLNDLARSPLQYSEDGNFQNINTNGKLCSQSSTADSFKTTIGLKAQSTYLQQTRSIRYLSGDNSIQQNASRVHDSAASKLDLIAKLSPRSLMQLKTISPSAMSQPEGSQQAKVAIDGSKRSERYVIDFKKDEAPQEDIASHRNGLQSEKRDQANIDPR